MAVTAARAWCLAALVAAGTAGRVGAQEAGPPVERSWWVSTSKWAKWPTLAAAVGLTAAAITRKADADAVYESLQAFCLVESGNCASTPGGTYANPEAEALYQETLRLDLQARRWMIGGQGFLFLSAGMFLIDLVAGASKPQNIPFTPLEAWAVPGQAGLRWRF
jgi:hypothetical protein